MKREDQVRDRQSANGMALTAMLPFPSLVSILFHLQLSACLLILHRIMSPSRTMVWPP
jgi:hypothetical protein